MNAAERLLGALEAERLATGYYLAAGAVAGETTVAAPDFASVDAASGGADLSTPMAYAAEQQQLVA